MGKEAISMLNRFEEPRDVAHAHALEVEHFIFPACGG